MKRLLIPVILLIVIVAVWLIQSSVEKSQTRVKAVYNFLELDIEKITKFVTWNKNDSITLYKENDVWFLQDSLPRRANPEVINTTLNESVQMRAENVISQNPERQAEFQVDEENGVHVQFYRENELLAHVIIGAMAPGYSHTYIRKPGSNDVFLAAGRLNYTYNRPLTGWLDKTILSLLSGNIASVEFIYPDNACRITRQDTIWTVSAAPYEKETPASEPQVDQFINTIINLQASDFQNASDSGLVDFDNLSMTMKISLFDGNQEILRFGAENTEGSRRYCRREGVPETFVIKRSWFDNLKLKYADFMPQE